MYMCVQFILFKFEYSHMSACLLTAFYRCFICLGYKNAHKFINLTFKFQLFLLFELCEIVSNFYLLQLKYFR
jgi:hypothetical protein